VEKFHWLSEPFADEDLRGRLIEAVHQLDARRISDLMDLLAQVRPTAVFPVTHPGGSVSFPKVIAMTRTGSDLLNTRRCGKAAALLALASAPCSRSTILIRPRRSSFELELQTHV